MKKYNVFAGLVLSAMFLFQRNVLGSQASNWYTPENLKARVQEGMDVAEGLKTAAQRRIDAAVVAAKEGIAYGVSLPGRLKTSVESAIAYTSDIPSNIVKEINSFIEEAVKNAKSKNDKLLYQFKSYTNMPELIQTTLPEQVEERIKGIINLKYISPESGQKIKFNLFPTPKSILFVLKNIDDFFEFKHEYKDLNAKIYEICTKMAREWEMADARATQQVPNRFADIDRYRDNYMKKYNISVATLSRMPDEELDEKIKNIEQEIKRVISSKQENVGEWARKDSPEFRALLAILTHLSFKKSNKERPMFIGVDAQRQLSKSQAEYAAKRQGIEASVAAHHAAQARGLGYQDAASDWTSKYPGLQLRNLPQAQQEQQQKAAQQQAEQSVEKQSLWSMLKSWWYSK